MYLLAKFIPTIRVVKIMDSYRNVNDFWAIRQRDTPECQRVERIWPNRLLSNSSIQWGSREGTVMRNDILERLGCEDTHFEDG